MHFMGKSRQPGKTDCFASWGLTMAERSPQYAGRGLLLYLAVLLAVSAHGCHRGGVPVAISPAKSKPPRLQPKTPTGTPAAPPTRGSARLTRSVLIGDYWGDSICLAGAWIPGRGWLNERDNQGLWRLMRARKRWFIYRLGQQPFMVATRAGEVFEDEHFGEFFTAHIICRPPQTGSDEGLAVESSSPADRVPVRSLPLPDRCAERALLAFMRKRGLSPRAAKITQYLSIRLRGGEEARLLAADVKFPPGKDGNEWGGSVVVMLRQVQRRPRIVSVLTDIEEQELSEAGYKLEGQALAVLGAEIIALHDVEADGYPEVALEIHAVDYSALELHTLRPTSTRRVMWFGVGI